MIYFVSDLHFGHKSILEFESETRGHYRNVEEMDADLIKQWNNIITNDDVVYYLGDFAFKSKQREIETILDTLRFKQMNVILGNHDNKPFRKAAEKFDNISLQWAERIKTEGKIFYLSHFPMMIGERANLYNIHGHLHSEPSPNPNYQINVGYDKTYKVATSMEDILKVAGNLEEKKRGLKHL